MSRQKRLHFSGCIYHVITRGLERKDIFTDDYPWSGHLGIMGSQKG